MNKTVTATAARKDFFKLLTYAGRPGANVTITLEDKPPVVMMSQDEFDGWMETMDIMSDPEEAADILKAIKKGEADMKAGRTIPWEKVKKEFGL